MSSISQFQFEQMQERLARNHHDPEAPPALEKDLHQEIMDYCDHQWPRWKYIHSRTDKPTRNEPGVPDFAILMPKAEWLLIECKRPGEKVSPAQRDWHAEAAKEEHIVRIVHSLEEFKLEVLKTINQQDHP